MSSFIELEKALMTSKIAAHARPFHFRRGRSRRFSENRDLITND
jgi:hypothetical protein